MSENRTKPAERAGKARGRRERDSELVVHASGVLRPRQRRSRRTLERLLDAAAQALEDSTFDRLTIAELTRRAGVAVGSFYRRFEDKEALLRALYARYEAERTAAFERAFDPAAWLDQPLSERCAGLASFFVEFSRRHRALLRSFSMFVRSRPERMRGGFEVTLHDLYDRAAAVLIEREDEIRHPEPDLAARFGLLMVAATCRNKIVFGEDPHPRSVAIDDERLAKELARALVSYLESGPGSDRIQE